MIGLITNATRPNKVTTKYTDEEYCLAMGRYAIGAGFNDQSTDWISQYFTNMMFCYGNQWINNEDLEAFLKDDSDQSRNRIKVKKNMILPTVSQYIGNAISMDMTVRCQAISPKAVNRRERKLEELVFATEIANDSIPLIREEFKKIYGIGDSVEETQRMFSNLWQDNYVKTMNMLMEYVADYNNFDEKKRILATNLALSGLATTKYTEWNGEMKWDVVNPEKFFFDHTATKPDLSDAGYMGEYDYMELSGIYELYPRAVNFKKELDSLVAVSAQNDSMQIEGYIKDGKMPVYKAYWLDSEANKYGYVIDEFGYPYYCKIDHIEPGATKPKYTKKDIIPYKDLNESQKKRVGTTGMEIKYFDTIKYVIFIPSEVGAANKGKDIVLEYGVMPYQDTEVYKFASAKFPYKNYTWYYSNGFIFSPISELINPQRMINRYESVKENLVNTSIPSVLAYDTSALSAEGGEREMLKNLYQGKPIKLNAKNMGVQNVIQKTSSTLDVNSISAYAQLADAMRMDMDRIVGVNDSMKGQSQGSEQLVGVTALQIQRASLIQEPFYDALAKVYEQMYQASANAGKRIYADNERELAVIVGDGNMQIIQLTKEYNTEDFRTFIHRQPNAEQQKSVANQQLLQFIQLDLIDKAILSDMWNRSTPDDVADAVRRSAQNDAEIAIRQQAVQQKQQEMMQQQDVQQQQQGMGMQQQERTDMLADKEKDREVKRQIKETEVLGKIAVAEMAGQQKFNQEKTVNTK